MLEFIKNIILKHILLKILSSIFSNYFLKKIRDFSIIVACLASLIIFFYLFKLDKYFVKSGSEHFRYSDFISSKIKPKIDSSIKELFDTKREEGSYLFISLVEIDFRKKCRFRWKYIKGFNEGSIKTFEEIKIQKNTYSEKRNWLCSDYDSLKKLLSLKQTRISVDISNRNSNNLLHTQKEWIEEDKSNYPIRYLTYYIIPYPTNTQFYLLQVASLKPLNDVISTNLLDTKFEDLTQIIQSIVTPKNWYEIMKY